MKKSVMAGAALATAVGLVFLARPAFAQSAEATPGTQQASVKCVGANDCKGQSACKSATSAGPGENSCKGQGLVMTSSDKECDAKGGKPAKM